MNDRFKFRAWDIEEQKYREVIALGQDRSFLLNIGHVRNDTQIFEQCTGLKDKNGKLIYDGDYIRAVNQDTKDRPDLQVGHIWVDEMGCRWIKFKTEELSWNDFCSLIDYDVTLEIEVIGNEHEERNFEQI